MEWRGLKQAWMAGTSPAMTQVAFLHRVRGIDVNHLAHLAEFLRHLLHALLGGECIAIGDRPLVRIIQRRRIIPHVLRDLDRTELRPAHRAEVRDLVRFLGQGLAVIAARRVGIEPEVELADLAEFEPRATARRRTAAWRGNLMARSAMGATRL
jgi:hypothetical protein